MERAKLIILGITGSVGKSAVSALRKFPDRFDLVGFSYHSNFSLAQDLAREFEVKNICCSRSGVPHPEVTYWQNEGFFFTSMEQILDVDYEKVLISVVGAAGARATWKAATLGKTILLANKESLVVLGRQLMEKALAKNAKIIPVDSEHNSLFRLMNGTQTDKDTLILTASGGSLLEKTPQQIYKAGIEEVLNHPTWDMGNKITVDSAGMINKALEIIEAHYLFHKPVNKIEAVIHPQSIVHAMLRKPDGSVTMHASIPDMMYPTAHAMLYPEEPKDTLPLKPISQFSGLQFFEVPEEKFPGFVLGKKAAIEGGTATAVYNAANEIAVENFLQGKINFGRIPELIDIALQKNPFTDAAQNSDIETMFRADLWARGFVQKEVL